ncbi:MAG: BlaI/MecI/CopY family transcriptional regulator [Anaerovoracaceae bacterium]
MTEYKLAEAESRFADLIWDNEPISSGQLVKLAGEKMEWKSTTCYTVLRRLCDRGLFQNENSVVTSCISREEFYSHKSRQFVEESFGGSLPKFLAAFMGKKKLSQQQIDEIRQMIDRYGEEE